MNKINWNVRHEEIDFSCPFCARTGRRSWDKLTPGEKEGVRESYDEYTGDIDWGTFFEEDLEKQEGQKVGIKDYYNNWIDDFDFYCEKCDDGHIEPSGDYAYPLECAELTNENKKIALNCGLFMFEDNKGVYMSLHRKGTNLFPNILKAYKRLEGKIPLEYVLEWEQNHQANLSEEDRCLKGKTDKTRR